MILAIGAAAPATVDWPVILLSALGGALLTALFALLGAWLSARRQHDAWVREKRYDAFVRIKTFHRRVKNADDAMRRAKAHGDEERKAHANKQFRALLRELPDALAPLAVLGPYALDEAGAQWLAAISRGDAGDDEETQLIALMRQALKVRD